MLLFFLSNLTIARHWRRSHWWQSLKMYDRWCTICPIKIRNIPKCFSSFPLIYIYIYIYIYIERESERESKGVVIAWLVLKWDSKIKYNNDNGIFDIHIFVSPSINSTYTKANKNILFKWIRVKIKLKCLLYYWSFNWALKKEKGMKLRYFYIFCLAFFGI